MPHRTKRYFLTECLSLWAVYVDGDYTTLVVEDLPSQEDAVFLAVAHGNSAGYPFRVYYAKPDGEVLTLHDSLAV